MEIRVVIEVPDEDREKKQEVIEAVTDAIKEQLPNLHKAKRYSPIIVTIRELNESVE